jgi:glycosyltransferase involved in cell wall biosynthesis
MISEKLNMLVLLRDYPVGLAVTKKIHNLLSFLVQQSVPVKILSYRSKFAQPVYRVEDDFIPFDNIGADLKLLYLHRTIGYFWEGLKKIKAFKNKGFTNIFYCIGPVNIENFLFVFWARIMRYRIVFDINEDYSFFEDDVKAISRLKIKTTRKLDVLTHKWASGITVVSTHLKNKYAGMTNKPVALIPVTAGENYRPDEKIRKKKLRVVYAGTFDLKDGVRTIIEGFIKFNKAYADAELFLLGKSEQQTRYQNEYKDRNNIVFMGYVPDKEFYAFLREADVLCMCRTNSGFSNAGFPFKLGEYLATGNPVISTRASDVCDYLTHDDAFLVDFDSPEEIASALMNIAQNHVEADRMGLNGFRKYQRYFSPDTNGRLLHDLLMSLE